MYESQSSNLKHKLASGDSTPSEPHDGVMTPSAEYRQFIRRRRRQMLWIRISQIVLLILILAVWELAAKLQWVNPMLTSSPSQIVSMVGQLVHNGEILSDSLITAKETVIGFVASMVIGIVAAVVLWWSSYAASVLDPYLVVLNALPKVALGPIFYIWLGDQKSIYGMAIAISVVVTVMMLASGFHEVDSGKLKLMESFGASKWQVLKKVVLPASIPNLVATMKVNVGLTLVGVIMGEFLSAKAGLGFLITYGGQVFQMGLVMTSILILVLFSLIMYGLLSYFGRWLLTKYHFE